ncbi:SagB family peptide dehydrogenase [Haloarchaeobius baliensis]|uniref:SagB family peptide dehydrogenase n=1 Tax=Haloarchaeobius baliensis TaxID=1670458 RepID=UPI003F88298F
MNVNLNRLRQLRSQEFDPTSTRLGESYFTEYTHKEFDEGSVAERFHENTKLTTVSEFSLGPAAGLFTADPSLSYAQARLQPDHGDAELVELPPTEGLDDRFDTVVVTRRSRREMAGEGVTVQELSTLLQHACGVTGKQVLAETDDADDVEKQFRSYASAGGLYPVEVYFAVVNESADLAKGLYYYVPEEHAVRVLDREPDVVDAVTDSISIPEDVHDPTEAAITVFLTGSLWRAMAKYGPRGYRFVLQESGHLAQNLQLAAGAMGLASVPLAAFYDDVLNDYLGVDGVNEAAVYTISVGRTGEDT